MQLSKTDFLQYLNCPKSLWLRKHKAELYPVGEWSDYAQKLASEGSEIEGYVQDFLTAQPNADTYTFQAKFRTSRGLYAKADVIRDNRNGTIDLYEVKSSTYVKKEGQHNHLQDATFQKVVAQESGQQVSRVFIIHLNKDYVRRGEIDPGELLKIVEVTEDVVAIEEETRKAISEALSLLAKKEVDESQCSCLWLTKSNRCDTFAYFNPAVPVRSIYDLPRISKGKIEEFVADGRFGLDGIDLKEVTEAQAPVLRSAQSRKPVIDLRAIADFYSRAEYPIYFLDYETYSSAIPLVDGARPQAPIPFQYSLHVKHNPDDTKLLHVEYLAEEAAMPISLIEHMQNDIGHVGSVVSWHAAFENTQNLTMARQYPEKAEFLNALIRRTLDLETLFKDGYVDFAFGGSTSIKKVLPVLIPDLRYEDLAVSNGTDAMDSWARLISMQDGQEKDKIREELLAYCKLDTLAMVRIFELIERL